MTGGIHSARVLVIYVIYQIIDSSIGACYTLFCQIHQIN